MVRQAVLLVGIVLGVISCVGVERPAPGTPPEAFAHRVATSEVVLLWNCLQPEPGLLRVVGEAQSPWQAQPIRFLELQVVGVDAQARETAQASGKARDIQIFTNQRSPFQLELRTAGTEVRFDLYYHYQFENEWDSDARLAGPAMVGPRLLAQTRSELARDVCSPTQHLAR